MPLWSSIELERRAQASITGGVVDEAGSVVTCVVHFGGCLYRPEVSRDDHELADLFWAAQVDLPREVKERFFPTGMCAIIMPEIREYRASLPCKVMQIPETEIRRRQEKAQRQKYQSPDQRDAEVSALADKVHKLRLESDSQYRALCGQYNQNVREGYGDAVPDFEETE